MTTTMLMMRRTRMRTMRRNRPRRRSSSTIGTSISTSCLDSKFSYKNNFCTEEEELVIKQNALLTRRQHPLGNLRGSSRAKWDKCE